MSCFLGLLLVAGSVCYVAGYATYALGIRYRDVLPNRWSWLIWSAATCIEASTYGALNRSDPQTVIFGLSAACCVALSIGIWSRARWAAPSPTELICVCASVTALLLWGVFHLAFWAHLIILAVVPVGFIPTWIGASQDRRTEFSPAWGLWTLGDLLTLASILAGLRNALYELPYILLELACHAGVWAIVGWSSLTSLQATSFRDR